MGNTYSPTKKLGYFTEEHIDADEFNKSRVLPRTQKQHVLYTFKITPIIHPASRNNGGNSSSSIVVEQQSAAAAVIVDSHQQSSSVSSDETAAITQAPSDITPTPPRIQGSISVDNRYLPLLTKNEHYRPDEDNIVLLVAQATTAQNQLPVTLHWDLNISMRTTTGDAQKKVQKFKVNAGTNGSIMERGYNINVPRMTIESACGKEFVAQRIDAMTYSARSIKSFSSGGSPIDDNDEEENTKVQEVSPPPPSSTAQMMGPIPKKRLRFVNSIDMLTFFDHHGGIGFRKNSLIPNMLLKSQHVLNEKYNRDGGALSTAQQQQQQQQQQQENGRYSMPFMSEYVNYDLHLYKTPLNGIVCMDIDTLELLRRELENSYTRHLRYLNTEQCTLTLKISQDKYNTVLAHAIKNEIKEYTCTLLLELEYLVVPAHEQAYNWDMPISIGMRNDAMLPGEVVVHGPNIVMM